MHGVSQNVVDAYASVVAAQGPDEVLPRPSKRMVIGKTRDASPTISVWLRPVKSNVDASTAGSITPFRFVSVSRRKDVLLRISTRDISSHVEGRRLTESYRARSSATLNSLAMFCLSRLEAEAPKPKTARVTKTPTTIRTMNSSSSEKPASLRCGPMFFIAFDRVWSAEFGRAVRSERGHFRPLIMYYLIYTMSSI